MTTTELAPFTRRPRLSIEALIAKLREQDSRKQDMVVPAHKMRVTPEGLLELDEPRITSSGVSDTSHFELTGTFDSGIAGKLKVPANYLARMREHKQLPLLAENVNTWLAMEPNRPFLVRTFHGDDDRPGVGRALLSDSYGIRDNLPLLMAVLEGIADRGAEVEITGELTDRRMIVKIVAPRVTTEATDLLRFYRSPFTGRTGADNPIVAAGVVLTNSELGFGASTITPQFTVQICTNGMTVTKDAMRTIHNGTKLEHGVIQYSAETIKRELATATSRARDAVRTFLNVDYMVRKLNEIAGKAHVDVIDPEATIQHVGKIVGYTGDEQNRILAHFIRGADTTAGGVLHAVTSAAQTLADADSAYEMERTSLRALEVAAAYQR
jgi:hypothetical protein